jgi:predicted PurR-regulated permease PerM
MTNSNRSSFPWVLVILAVLVVTVSGAAWYLAVSLRNQVNNTLSPLQQTNNAISTQIASLLHPHPNGHP